MKEHSKSGAKRRHRSASSIREALGLGMEMPQLVGFQSGGFGALHSDTPTLIQFVPERTHAEGAREAKVRIQIHAKAKADVQKMCAGARAVLVPKTTLHFGD